MLSCSEDSIIKKIGIAIDEVSPAGGPPGTIVAVKGVNFSEVVTQNSVTVDGLMAEVVFATDTLLMVQLPLQAPYAKAELIVTSGRLLPDTGQVIVSENPLAEISEVMPRSSLSETVLTVLGSNFSSDKASYGILYHKADGTVFFPTNDEGTYRNTLLEAYADSLLIQIPEGFREGHIRIITKTIGEPTNMVYELFTPYFTVL
ncbi:MAG: IPT/TIG domain-containing protein [Tunicatimonas sp.]